MKTPEFMQVTGSGAPLPGATSVYGQTHRAGLLIDMPIDSPPPQQQVPPPAQVHSETPQRAEVLQQQPATAAPVHSSPQQGRSAQQQGSASTPVRLASATSHQTPPLPVRRVSFATFVADDDSPPESSTHGSGSIQGAPLTRSECPLGPGCTGFSHRLSDLTLHVATEHPNASDTDLAKCGLVRCPHCRARVSSVKGMTTHFRAC